MKDLLEKGAVLQRDKETYAIAPHIPAGLITSEQLRKIADVADKYNLPAIKITAAQRIALVGLKESDIDDAWNDLGMKPGAAIGLCVRSIKTCPGTTFCKRAFKDSVTLVVVLIVALIIIQEISVLWVCLKVGQYLLVEKVV